MKIGKAAGQLGIVTVILKISDEIGQQLMELHLSCLLR